MTSLHFFLLIMFTSLQQTSFADGILFLFCWHFSVSYLRKGLAMRSILTMALDWFHGISLFSLTLQSASLSHKNSYILIYAKVMLLFRFNPFFVLINFPSKWLWSIVKTMVSSIPFWPVLVQRQSLSISLRIGMFCWSIYGMASSLGAGPANTLLHFSRTLACVILNSNLRK